MVASDENELFINQKGFDQEIDLETILGIIEVWDECYGDDGMMMIFDRILFKHFNNINSLF